MRAKPSTTGRRISQAGVSLLEMLVVLTIIGLVIAALPAVLSAGLPGLRLKSQAREMVDNLRNVHLLAQRSGKEIVVTLDSEHARYGVSPGAQPTVLSTGIALRFERMPFSETEGPTAHIRFFPDGSSTGGSVGLAQKGQQYWIDIDWLTGRASIRD